MCLFMFNGCSLLRLPKIIEGNQPAIKQIKSKNYNKFYYKNKKTGETLYEINKGNKQVVPEKTLAQKIGAWFSGLTIIGLILLGVGLFFAPTVTIGILFSVYRRIGRALRETVTAIKLSQAVNRDDELHNELKSNQSKETKKIVSKIKMEI